MNPSPLLDLIDSPQDLRRLDKKQLPRLAGELRTFLLESVGQTGGHFASNLGAVELTIALHYVYDTPEDKLVWDVGHQSYPHKILTGRKNQMHTMRQYGGLAGFPKRCESEYDAFGVGHSSTSIGAALGMAAADKLLGSDRRSVAIIGDGAMTAGQAFEALNCAGDMDVDLLVVLNDNEMSISPNVGALPKYLASNVVRDMHGLLSTVKAQTGKVLDKIPGAMEFAQKVEHKIKTLAEEAEHAKQSLSLFENFGFRYTGPVDGHNVENLVDVLKDLRSRKGPQLLHVITKKGNGYKLAENDPVKYHAVANLPKESAAQMPSENKPAAKPTYTQVFGKWLCDRAAADSRLVAITPAMREGSGLVEFEQRFPDRYFDVGIAEQHAVTFAGGLACEGMKPVVAIYSTFLQRAYDQLVHDIALQNLPVLFAVDRAGIVGADGPTHAGLYDLSFLRCIPNMIVAAPSDENECRLLLSTCYQADAPAAVRYPRGTGTGVPVSDGMETVEIGKGIIRREGEKTAFIAFGSMVAPALAVAEKLNATVADMRFVKPIDEELIVRLARSHDRIVTLEENAEQGGAGGAVLEVLAKHGICKPVLLLGVADTVTGHGDPKKLLDDLGLSAEAVERRVRAWLSDRDAAN
ncbi:TPA: 1-deoxy-D-xylulose-5-phosphate synthase [Neisseria meningitidis]|uniref:1-deoxy-D-xylulose-5-phosphate synthase n=1 Tax=Neisseria meningitidis serogroup C (strain 053442) TaxID=374833 RepID=DXS_NEIM0|nr:1-deoxy-D-xylulose-5-phosphate synthase [Neisseria meningitidis]A9M1G3.1 RecName: Full=1-deoxy-D-xylulose-5-phosphate synthase; AltName: Full=1-deoxyxylulose-5-phosphate synthase; Short=DXP synthase; Short=DXPS [Neisseria meningitidis 053442]ABX72561.1 1-deoxyxylulose-5-phosphate synthase [Neisseria meningitidis 053442]MCG3358497.1 1-deoxy-D-xylulose-5-phosphate synthase [Neisseria meningitidis]MCL4976229.1 1-deoxy-D-xylulose-5-phosphate synthase [Neisseria meningitidis]MCL4986569.1 1-deoxy